jgi:hypothetical protein
VNLLSNDIGVEQAGALMIILKEHPTLKSLCGNKGGETELDMSGKMKGAEDAIMLAAEIVDNEAMTKLDISDNDMRADGCKAVAGALKGKNTLTELNIASNDMTYGSGWGDMSAIITLADAIPDMRALTSLNLSGNKLGTFVSPGGWSSEPGDAWKYRHADGRKTNTKPEGEKFKSEGIIAIADAIPDMGAMTSLNFSYNELGAEGAVHVAEAIKVKNRVVEVVLEPN